MVVFRKTIILHNVERLLCHDCCMQFGDGDVSRTGNQIYFSKAIHNILQALAPPRKIQDQSPAPKPPRPPDPRNRDAPPPRRCLGPLRLPIIHLLATPSFQLFSLNQADTPPLVARSLLGQRMGGDTDGEAKGCSGQLNPQFLSQFCSGQLNPQFLSQLVSVQPLSPCTQAGQEPRYQL